MRREPQETIGQRIGRLRQQAGLTQQRLAERIAVSRVAVSHIELDITTPGERTITLLAGLFKVTPPALVAGTTYPLAKAERLSLETCTHTPLELELALLHRDVEWLHRLRGAHRTWDDLVSATRASWLPCLARWEDQIHDSAAADALDEARAALYALT